MVARVATSPALVTYLIDLLQAEWAAYAAEAIRREVPELTTPRKATLILVVGGREYRSEINAGTASWDLPTKPEVEKVLAAAARRTIRESRRT